MKLRIRVKYLNNVLTDIEGDVYAFNNNYHLFTVACMARLSRRGDDMRIHNTR